jgi:hypothetical protein
MKALITALALVALISGPTFARPAAARASTQAEFVFPTDQELCQSLLSVAGLSPVAVV